MNSKKAVERIMKVLGLTYTTFFEAQTEQGMMMKMEGELEVGHPIYISTEEGLIPAPPGMHKLEDGTEIEVDEEGKVKKINMGEVEAEETEDVKKEDEDTEEVIAEDDMSAELFGDVNIVDGTILRMEGDTEIIGRRVKKVGYDGTLSAVADGEYETVGGKVLQIVGGSIQGVQSVADNNKRKTGFAEDGTYDWDTCMADQLKQYGDEETAKKVCGAIKAGNMNAMFAEAKDKSGLLLSAPNFEMGDEVKVVMEDGEMVRAKDQGYDIKLGDKEMTIFVTDGKISKIEPLRKGEGPEDKSTMEDEDIEKMAEVFTMAFKKLEEKIDAYISKQKELEGKFEKFSKAPAGSRVYTQKTINEETDPFTSKLEAFKKLRMGS